MTGDARQLVAAALVQLAAADRHAALRSAQRAAVAGSTLAAAVAAFLAGEGHNHVYGKPSGFEAFIDGGGNRHLYRRVADELRAVQERVAPTSLLDIGCGDGRLTTASISPGTERIDLVEPSDALLDFALSRLGSFGIEARGHPLDAMAFLDGIDAETRWDLAMSTFALHTLEPARRSRVLALLARRAAHLVLVEFDVPALVDRSPEHAAYVADRYERGVEEYVDRPEVITGFLVPVMVGQFDPARPRLTYEQPIDAWVEQLASTGWRVDRRVRLAEYWWAPAELIEASAPDAIR